MHSSSVVFVVVCFLMKSRLPGCRLKFSKYFARIKAYFYKFRFIFAAFIFFFTGYLASAIANDIWGPVIITCVDGWHSPSIGRQGACSHHGGVKPDPRSGWLFLISLVSALATYVFLKSLAPTPIFSEENLDNSSSSHNRYAINKKLAPSNLSEAERKRRRYFASKRRRKKTIG